MLDFKEKSQTTTPYEQMADAWRLEGKLRLQKCTGCERHLFCPTTRCPRCWSDELVSVTASGRGVISSFSLVHRGLPEPLQSQAPITIAEIHLEEGAVLIARVLSDATTEIYSGSRVVLVEGKTAKEFSLPTFQLLNEEPK